MVEKEIACWGQDAFEEEGSRERHTNKSEQTGGRSIKSYTYI